MGRHVIRRIRFTHCKRGPADCEICRETDVEQLCLLAVHPPNEGLMQRRLIEVELGGETVWRAFDVLRVFESAQEATAYARERGIQDVQV